MADLKENRDLPNDDAEKKVKLGVPKDAPKDAPKKKVAKVEKEKKLSDKEIKAAVAYLASLHPTSNFFELFPSFKS